MAEKSKKLVDSSVVMQHFCVTRNTLRAWDKKGFPVHKSELSNKKYYYLDECEEFFTTGKVKRRKKAPK